MDLFSTALADPPTTATGRRRWTRDECRYLENSGLLKGRYELIDGEVVSKMGQNGPHATAVMLVIAYLLAHFGQRRVRTQATMEVRENDQVTNRPEPDVVALRAPIAGVPTGADVLLAVEVSDTTQGDDFGFKLDLYARAGIEEYWVLDLARCMLVAFHRPEAGEWQERTEYSESATVTPRSAPNAPLRVADLLP